MSKTAIQESTEESTVKPAAVEPKQIEAGQISSYRIEAIERIQFVRRHLESLATKLRSLNEDAFWSPDKAVSAVDRVIHGILDVSYDDDQKATESKQHVGACAVPSSILDVVAEVNNAKALFRAYWSRVGKIRVRGYDKSTPYLAQVVLDGTEFSRVNTHQLGRKIHTISQGQPLRMGFTQYGSPNPKRISKNDALNRIAKSLPEELHSYAREAFSHIAEDEDVCLLRGNTPKARMNYTARHGSEKTSGQHPAVLPILYLDEGKETVITYRGARSERVKKAPRKREADPIYPGLEMYRYLPDYRYSGRDEALDETL